MKSADERELSVEFDFHQCALAPAAMDKMRAGLGGLESQVENFPTRELKIMVERNTRSNDYSVKLSLFLGAGTLVGNDHDTAVYAAFERCLQGLIANVQAYKARLDHEPERQKVLKGTRQLLGPNPDPDLAAADAAVAAGDYAKFRTAILGYEEPLRKRAGRWVERYPQVAARIGKGLEVADIVDEVFLTAFEGYTKRPRDVRLGDWLAGLLDPAIRTLAAAGDEELENIRLARLAVEAEEGPGTA
jgi:ribosome-associated translation inhibitor RaiA